MTSNLEVSEFLAKEADWQVMERRLVKFVVLMTEEPLDKATATMLVGTFVGWFYTTLNAEWRVVFEQLVETQLEIAAGYGGES